MSVGDVNSNARGSGARYNDGKAPLQLIPLSLIADSLCDAQLKALGSETACALAELGDFQTTHEIAALDRSIGNLHGYWRDCAVVFDYGRKKYSEWNWSKGMQWSIPLACAARHALAILEGEEIDSESCLPHVGHLLCNLVMLRTFVDTYPEGNDLPPKHLFQPDPHGGLSEWEHQELEEHHAVEAPMPPTVDFVVHPLTAGGDFTVESSGVPLIQN